MSCGPGMSPRIERKRILQASDGVNTCLPDASGAQSISSGLLDACTTPAQAISVFALQVWKGLCYLYGLILTSQSDITTLQDDIVTLQAEIAALPAMRTPGNVSVAAGASLGAGATASVVGNDSAGQVTIECGVGGGGLGSMVDFTFDTPYTTAGVLVIIPQTIDTFDPASLDIGTNCGVGTASIEWTNGGLSIPYTGQEMIYNYYVINGT